MTTSQCSTIVDLIIISITLELMATSFILFNRIRYHYQDYSELEILFRPPSTQATRQEGHEVHIC